MKKYYKILSVIGISTLLLTSCVNDLDTLPLTDTILLPETAWEDPASYEQFTSKVYAGFALSGNESPAGQGDIANGDQSEATFLRSYWNMQELTTDEVVCAWDDDGIRGLQFTQWNATNKWMRLNYNRCFMTIAYANEFLRETTPDKLAERGVSNELSAQVSVFRNEVRALRAMNYYFLMDFFANIPFIPEEAGVGAFLPEQKDRAFFFPWIESELKAVEANLPANSHSNYGKATQATAWMVLAKLYLNAEVYINTPKYTEALTYLNKVIGAGYTLDPVYKNMFGADNYKSTEIIFPLVFDSERATTWGGSKFLVCAASKSDMNTLVTLGSADSWSGNRSTEAFSSLFSDTDSRALFWKTDRTQETTQWYDFNKGWSVIKFTNLNSDGTPAMSATWLDTDFPVYRLADAYLMYAEAVVRGGQGGTKSQALIYLNALRTRANASIIAESDITLQYLIDERSRELYWEGHRRTDLIRFDRFTNNYAWPWKNGVYSGTASIDSKYAIFPIPDSEMTANPGIKQNKGY